MNNQRTSVSILAKYLFVVLLALSLLGLPGCISSSVITKPIRGAKHLSGSVIVAPISPPGNRQVTIKSTTIVTDGMVSSPINIALTWDDSDCAILRSSVASSLQAGGAFDRVTEAAGDYVVKIRLDEAGITNMHMPTCHLKGEIVIAHGQSTAVRRSFDVSAMVLSAASTVKNKAIEKVLAEVGVALSSL